tara:strand:- start:1515 stop:2516 length:1002 start_codon:yes stop_codon:yes gene_type:complete
MSQKRVLTGVKPTGTVHLGNYVGAIKPAVRLINDARDCYLFVADYHALNAVRDAKEMRESTYRVAATYLALGIDLDKTVFYRQSDIPEIFELATILATVTPKGLMNRAHAYKAMLDKNAENGKKDLDDGVNMGLYTYPILMAADILIADADIIPVGKDQVQHIEMTRDMAGSFNHLFGQTLKLPEFQVQQSAGAIPGLDGQKMSKSYNNIIPMFETNKRRQKMIMKIVTDSKLPEEPKDPDQSTIYQLYTQFATANEQAEMRKAFEAGGMGYGDAKKLLAEAVNRELEAPTEKYNEWLDNRDKIDSLLAEGAEKARATAKETMRRVRKSVGLG